MLADSPAKSGHEFPKGLHTFHSPPPSPFQFFRKILTDINNRDLQQQSQMLSPVRQEWRRVATVDNINLNSSEQGNISGGCGSSFVASTTQDSAKKESAKAILHQLCIKEHWKQPVYECCNAEGPDHHKLFTFKVLLDINIEGAPQILECFGNPRPSKKAAAEDAAGGALWCLKHEMGNQLNRQ